MAYLNLFVGFSHSCHHQLASGAVDANKIAFVSAFDHDFILGWIRINREFFSVVL